VPPNRAAGTAGDAPRLIAITLACQSTQMSIWFVRCNGETGHNQPGTARFVPGEPPTFPNREFNYRDDCLCKGFARVGWPGSGDLRNQGWRATASHVYGSVIQPHHLRFLEQFRDIEIGDIVLLPSYAKRYEVYIGEVVPPRIARAFPRTTGAYYYYFDVAKGDWFENAHRVDVRWARQEAGLISRFSVPEIGGTWIRGFGQVKTGSSRIVGLLRSASWRMPESAG
jgi:hypothetical protein